MDIAIESHNQKADDQKTELDRVNDEVGPEVGEDQVEHPDKNTLARGCTGCLCGHQKLLLFKNHIRFTEKRLRLLWNSRDSVRCHRAAGEFRHSSQGPGTA